MKVLDKYALISGECYWLMWIDEWLISTDVLLGWSLCLGEGHSGSHTRCLLLRLPRVTGARGSSCRAFRGQVGSCWVAWAVYPGHSADTRCCQSQLHTPYIPTCHLRNRIGESVEFFCFSWQWFKIRLHYFVNGKRYIFKSDVINSNVIKIFK